MGIMNVEWIVVLATGSAGVLALVIGAVISAMGGNGQGFKDGAGMIFIATILALMVAGGVSGDRRSCTSLANQLEGEIMGDPAWACNIRLPDGRVISA